MVFQRISISSIDRFRRHANAPLTVNSSPLLLKEIMLINRSIISAENDATPLSAETMAGNRSNDNDSDFFYDVVPSKVA